ncbi:MAG TPA: extracellular solute-binding protein [Actinomycetota bacterium]|nr:extracellular solute-binding protein [Actinomycetota bacterium]
MRSPRRLLVLPVMLLVVATAACAGGREALTIYSGRDEALVGPLLEDFAEETGIDIDVKYGDSGDLALLIAEEGDASPADVFLSQSPGPAEFLQQEGRLGAIPGEARDLVPPEWQGRDGEWVGVTARQRVLVYNTEMVAEEDLPESVFDLVRPEYEAAVAVAPTNASFQDFVTAMRATEGDAAARDWLEGMAANRSPAYADNSSIVAAVGRGEIPMGLVNHYYNYRALEEDPDAPSANYVFPSGDLGSLLIASTVSVLGSADDAERANRFVEFLLTEDAQEYFSEETFEYPLAEGAAAAAELPPLDEDAGLVVELSELGDLRTTAQMIEDSGLL